MPCERQRKAVFLHVQAVERRQRHLVPEHVHPRVRYLHAVLQQGCHGGPGHRGSQAGVAGRALPAAHRDDEQDELRLRFRHRHGPAVHRSYGRRRRSAGHTALLGKACQRAQRRGASRRYGRRAQDVRRRPGRCCGGEREVSGELLRSRLRVVPREPVRRARQCGRMASRGPHREHRGRTRPALPCRERCRHGAEQPCNHARPGGSGACEARRSRAQRVRGAGHR